MKQNYSHQDQFVFSKFLQACSAYTHTVPVYALLFTSHYCVLKNIFKGKKKVQIALFYILNYFTINFATAENKLQLRGGGRARR